MRLTGTVWGAHNAHYHNERANHNTPKLKASTGSGLRGSRSSGFRSYRRITSRPV